jgi:hypothetical protein
MYLGRAGELCLDLVAFFEGYEGEVNELVTYKSYSSPTVTLTR